MKIIGTLLAVLVSCLLVQTVAGSCFNDKLKSEMTASRRLRFYCEFKHDGGSKLKLLPGSKLILADQCLECSCSTNGLQCCGFGRMAGVVSFPPNCKALHDGCHTLAVLKSNHSKSCANESIDFNALSRRLPHPDNTFALTGSSMKPVPINPIGPIFTPQQTTEVPRFGANIRTRLYDYLRSMFHGEVPKPGRFPVTMPTTVFRPAPFPVTQQIMTLPTPPPFAHISGHDHRFPLGSLYHHDSILPWLLL